MNRRSFLKKSSLGALVASSSSIGRGDAKRDRARPVVFWVADPVQPGDTLMLFGHGLENAKVFGLPLENGVPESPSYTVEKGPVARPSGESLTILQRSARCLKVEIPASWRSGTYVVYVVAAPGDVLPLVVNRPQIWWAIGDAGSSASPGSQLRLFGKNFQLGGGDAVRGSVFLRDAKGQGHTVQVSAADPYSLSLTVPATTALGTTEIFVHNGSGVWSLSLVMEIKAKESWPSDIFNVHDFGAVGDSLQDDTPAIRAALEKCQQNGGGTVLLPRGVYRVMGQLTIPPHTVVRGEKREVTWLFVPKDVPEFNSVLAGNGDFAVEDLSMVAQTPLRMITAPDVDSMYHGHKPRGEPGEARAHDVFLRRLRIHHLRYAHRVGPVDKDPRRSESAGPSTVALAGPRLEISDCEIVSPGMPIILHDTKHTRLLRNTLHNGRGGWYGIMGATETVLEGNIIRGQDLEATYGGFQNGPATDISRLYIAHNRFLDSFGGEREAMTFDTPGPYPWIGRVQEADAQSLSADGKDVNWAEDSFKGLACLIIAGQGLGQHRRIVSNGAGRLVVDSQWDVVPDSSSVAAVRPFRRDVVVYKNDSQDTSVGLQLWAGGYNFIIDSSTSIRTGGFWGTAAQYDRPTNKNAPHVILPCYFTQWLNNEIREGFIYQQGPEVGNYATLGLYVRNIPSGPDAGVLTLGNVIRGNNVGDNTRIGLFHYGEGNRLHAEETIRKRGTPVGIDTVIEGNTVSDSPVGIDVEPGYEGTVIRNNTFVRVAQQVRQAK